jgi:hypothetical protein
VFLVHPKIEFLEITESGADVSHFIHSHGFAKRCATGQYGHENEQEDCCELKIRVSLPPWRAQNLS